MKTAYFDCFSGIAGDMALAALVDAGLSLEYLTAELRKLPLDGYSIESQRIQRGGIEALNLEVAVHERQHSHGHHHGRHLPEILSLISESSLDNTAKERASAVFNRLADAEARVHGTTPDKIHFHEVGAVDAIVDIVGVCVALSLLEVEQVFSSPLPMGHGFVKCAHGIIPIPPPAVVELTAGHPVYGVDVEGELVTPTGAAIVTTLAENFGPCPPLTLQSTGYGAGKKEFPDRPNLLRVLIGDVREDTISSDRITVLEANIDDMNPEFYEHIMAKLFEAGALDVFMSPIQMKKNRPATLLSVLAPPEKAPALARKMIEETTTLGVRAFTGDRLCCRREVRSVETAYGMIRVKFAWLDGLLQTVAPEYEDCRRAANTHGIPLKLIYEEARMRALHEP